MSFIAFRAFATFSFIAVFSACGVKTDPKSNQDSSVKIYQGGVASPGHWATQVAAKLSIKKNGAWYICSAGVIGSKALLSNAHCFINKDGSQANVEQVEVYFGDKGQHGPYKVTWWNSYVHTIGSASDIALVEVASIPDFVIPGHVAGADRPLKTGWLAGYGHASTGWESDPAANLASGILRDTSLACTKVSGSGAPGTQYDCYSNFNVSPDAAGRGGDSGGVVWSWDPDRRIQWAVGLNWGSTSVADLKRTTLINIEKVRDRINYLNTGCRLSINNLPC